MEKAQNKTSIDEIICTIFAMLFIFTFVLYIGHVYLPKTISILILAIDIYAIVKYRKNNILFTIFLCILYFDYSVVISKYLLNIGEFSEIYEQIRCDDTMIIGILSVYLMHVITLLFMNLKINTKLQNKAKDIKLNDTDDKTKKMWAIIMTIGIIIITFDNKIFHIFGISNRIMEYTLILFIFVFYYFRNNRKMRLFLFFLMLLNIWITMKAGARVSIIQIILAYVFICQKDKINTKRIFVLFIVGIILFTVAGLYGDYLDTGRSYGEALKMITPSKIIETFSVRKLALDTSYSAYWTGLTMVDVIYRIPFMDRLINGIQYFTTYTILGQKSGYMLLPMITINYYTHYYGGFLNAYFFYWMGWIGITFIGIVLSKYFRIIEKENDKSSDFIKLMSVYILATVPRWYLYEPTTLFRGFLIFTIIYFVMYHIPLDNLVFQNQKRKKVNDNNE